MSRAWLRFRLGVSLLTVVPVRFGPNPIVPADLAAARWAFPAAGILIGCVLAGLSAALGTIHAPPAVAAFLLVLTSVAITGGLHLDGLADAADGLFLAGGADRRLAVMRDPNVGSFGAAALVLVLLGKFAALSALPVPARNFCLWNSSVTARCAAGRRERGPVRPARGHRPPHH